MLNEIERLVFEQEVDFTNVEEKQSLHEKMKMLSKTYVVRVLRVSNRRTNQQSKYYWASLRTLCEHQGMPATKDNLQVFHKYFCEKFLSAVITVPGFGEEMKFVDSSRQLSTVEFSQFFENVRTLVWDAFEFWLPDPKDKTIFYEKV